MKEHKITILLIVVVVITEAILIKGYYTNKITNINVDNLNCNSSDKATLPIEVQSIIIDTLFFQNQINKLIYFIPESYSCFKIRSEINLLQHNLLEFNSENYTWILSTANSSDHQIKKSQLQ